MTSSPAAAHRGERAALVAMGAALLGLLVSAAVFKLQHPGLVQQRASPGAHSGQREQAMAMISRLMERLQENPEDREALRGLAQTFTAMQAWERANTFWRRLVALPGADLQARRQLAMTYFRLDKHRQAAEELRKVLAADPGDLYAHYNLGVLSMHYLGAPEEAVEHFRAVVQSSAAPDQLRKDARKHLQELENDS